MNTSLSSVSPAAKPSEEAVFGFTSTTVATRQGSVVEQLLGLLPAVHNRTPMLGSGGPTEFRLRRAQSADAARIARIARAVNIKTFQSFGKGFLVYSLAEEEYRKRIDDGQHVFLFVFNEETVGFVCGYDPPTLSRYLDEATLAHEMAVGRQVNKLARLYGFEEFAFLDSIAIEPAFQNKSIGEQAFAAVCKSIPAPFFVAMLESPIRNPRIKYWVKRGFIRIGQVLQPMAERFQISDRKNSQVHLHWGIYFLPQGGFEPKYCPFRSDRILEDS